MDFPEKIKTFFNKKGWRITPATQNVVDILHKISTPISVQEILSILERMEHPVDLTTVYRILDRLIQSGMVHDLKGKFVLCSDPERKGEHHFLWCTKCQNTEEIFLDYKDSIAKQLASEKNFLLQEVDLLFKGICKNCAKK